MLLQTPVQCVQLKENAVFIYFIIIISSHAIFIYFFENL